MRLCRPPSDRVDYHSLRTPASSSTDMTSSKDHDRLEVVVLEAQGLLPIAGKVGFRFFMENE